MEHEFLLTNNSSSDKDLILEPWGEIHPFASSSTLQILAEGPEEKGLLEIEYGDSQVTLHAWPDGSIRIYSNGKEIKSGLGDRGPAPG